MYKTPCSVLRIRNCRTLLHMCWTDAVYTLTRWQHFFCAKWPHGRHVKSTTSNRKYDSDNRISPLEEHSFRISPWSDLKRWSLRLFWRPSLEQEQEESQVIGNQFWSKRKTLCHLYNARKTAKKSHTLISRYRKTIISRLLSISETSSVGIVVLLLRKSHTKYKVKHTQTKKTLTTLKIHQARRTILKCITIH